MMQNLFPVFAPHKAAAEIVVEQLRAPQPAFIKPVRTAVLTEAPQPGVPAPLSTSHLLQSELREIWP